MTDRTPSRRLFALPHIVAAVAMFAAAGLGLALAPKKADLMRGGLGLEKMVPAEFGDWREVKTAAVQMDLAPKRDDGATDPNSPYDETVMRTYVRKSDGAVVMLALAWGAHQRQEVKIHRPELCYVAQGFQVSRRDHVPLALGGGGSVTATRLLASNPSRVEPVTYWIRIGDEISQSAWQSRIAILREGLKGRVADGILVRVSQALPPNRADVETSFKVQEEFLAELMRIVNARGEDLFTRAPGSADKAS